MSAPYDMVTAVYALLYKELEPTYGRAPARSSPLLRSMDLMGKKAGRGYNRPRPSLMGWLSAFCRREGFTGKSLTAAQLPAPSVFVGQTTGI